MGMTIREARLPDDQATIERFVLDLQRYEAAFEPNRRLDAAYVADQYGWLSTMFAKGRIFIAENAGVAIGWALVHADEGDVYEAAAERRFATIRELYVAEAARGKGAGQALLAACEEWARVQGFSVIRISHLAQNALAEKSYARAGYAPYTVTRRKRL